MPRAAGRCSTISGVRRIREECLKLHSTSTSLYRTVARLLGRTLLASPIVRSVYIRRSVAAGEASFPFSDLDLAMVVDNGHTGAQLNALRRRFLLSRVAFPRLGECQLFTQDDLNELAVTDPYRSSLDRRIAVPVYGPPPLIPETPLPMEEVIRRLVFWFDGYIPIARRTNNRRNLRKFVIELSNALGVLEGRWPLPLTSRRETLEHCAEPVGDLFTACCTIAAQAHARARPPAPAMNTPLFLPGLTVAPLALAVQMPTDQNVITPEILDLQLQFQKPWLWHTHGEALAQAGFDAPSEATWRAAARRYAAGERVRGPGFLERTTAPAFARLRASAAVLAVNGPTDGLGVMSPSSYYHEHYERLVVMAAALRTAASTRTSHVAL